MAGKGYGRYGIYVKIEKARVAELQYGTKGWLSLCN